VGIGILRVLRLQVLRSLAYDPALAQTRQVGSWASPSCPTPAIFQDPWVKENFVLAYAHALKDGLGGQVSSIQLRC
jgi:hypothetical protein